VIPIPVCVYNAEVVKSLDYLAPFTYFFKDKNWLKIFLVASLLTYTILGAAPVFGWMIVIIRRIGRAEKPEIPELLDWKTFWRLGGKFASVNVLWLLPVLLAVILLYLPLVLANRLATETLLAVWGGTLCCVLVFLLFYVSLFTFFFPAMQVVLAHTGSAWQAAHPVRLWKTICQQPGGYLMVFLIVGLGLLNVILATAALTAFLLLPPLLVYAGLVGAHFAGQLLRTSHFPLDPPPNGHYNSILST
jgi:hypothetical protein